MTRQLINEKHRVDPANKAMVLDQWMTPPCVCEALIELERGRRGTERRRRSQLVRLCRLCHTRGGEDRRLIPPRALLTQFYRAARSGSKPK
jgi:hypothetical protein